MSDTWVAFYNIQGMERQPFCAGASLELIKQACLTRFVQERADYYRHPVIDRQHVGEILVWHQSEDMPGYLWGSAEPSVSAVDSYEIFRVGTVE